ncbi:hypothetical protein OSB04_009642 [Centaurea solstitialis]|uniref:PGG domain-containing protein n=1 Tax=Centaurea solstitialis TaxID=347529 RepID=A0AA38T610_9ASTR|nr:hypothetical protein OSB04_009642 [Centaurea solstitialis]
MDSPVAGNSHQQQSLSRTRTMEKRDDTRLHIAIRAGDMDTAMGILSGKDEQELKELLSKTNQSGETALYVAAEYSCVDLVKEMIKFYDSEAAGIKAKNGFDAFISRPNKEILKQFRNGVEFSLIQNGVEFKVLKVLMEAISELSMTFDQANTTALHTASEQGHIEVVKFLLEKNCTMATIARSNLKTALHSSARKGHLEVVKALLEKAPEIATRADKKGQTALHMAAKGQSVDIINELIAAENGLINMVDKKENTVLHIATRKGRKEVFKKVDFLRSKYYFGFEFDYDNFTNSDQNFKAICSIVLALLNHKEIINKEAVNKSGETALDTAEKFGRQEIATVLREHGVVNAKSLKKTPPLTSTARELKQTVSDIKHEVHDQLEHTLKTHKRVKGIGKRINKMHHESLNNAINSTTVVAVLIATVTFAAIYQLPGQYADNIKTKPANASLGEANIAPNPEFIVFLIFDSLALFISLAVVVVQTSIVVVERRAKKQVMAVINKLMWLASVFVSIAFLALSFIVVGNEKWLAVGVTVIGSVTLASTLGTMCYWVIMHRIEANNLRSIRRSARSSKSLSGSVSVHSSSENDDFKKLYAI